MSGSFHQSTHNGVAGRLAGRNGARPRRSGSSKAVTNGSNGTGPAAVNGSSASSQHLSSRVTGSHDADADADPYIGLDPTQVTRIMIQALSTTYPSVAEHLRRESGCEIDYPIVGRLRAAILEGAWADVERMMHEVVATEVEGMQQDRLVLASDADPVLMEFWIGQQKYLELLECGDTSKALSVLRDEIAPICPNTERLHLLSGLLMTQGPEDLRQSADWDGISGSSRRVLLSKLSDWISPSVMMPEHRLFTILNNTFDLQSKACKFHTIKEPRSLYVDHACPREEFPDTLALSLPDLGAEVWKVEFSHDGKKLAACGKTNQVLVWAVPSFELVCSLKGHRDSVNNISWSPDDSRIVTCSFDNRARLWNATDGALLHSLDQCDEPATGCEWSADGRTFTISSFDKHRGLRTYTTYGSVVHEWNAGFRVQDVATSADGRWLVTVDHTSLLHIWNAQTHQSLFTHQLESRPTSIVVSRDNVHLLVNRRDGRAHLFNLETREITQTFLGHVGGKHQIRTAFGGPDEDYVVCGSEDGHVFIWQRRTGELVLKLAAHKPMCNAVAWNPTDPSMFASCGDDGVVKIWTNKERAISMQRPPPRNRLFGTQTRDPFAPVRTLA